MNLLPGTVWYARWPVWLLVRHVRNQNATDVSGGVSRRQVEWKVA